MASVYHILYNPLAGNGRGYEKAQELSSFLPNERLDFDDITAIKDITKFISDIPESENIVIAGGDGTLNRFVNDFDADGDNHRIMYCAVGSGNDFATDIGKKENELADLAPYIKNLPSVTVNSKESVFINGIGYGIDGYCCEEGDKIRSSNATKQINYTAIAIKGLLHGYHPANAVVTVDGIKHSYKKVWLAPTMKGRYYCGGMMVAPKQNRLDEKNELSVVVMHGSGKLKTLAVFPGIFKGEHTKHSDMVDVLTGSSITVEFDRPTALQIDGETVTGVTKYCAKSSAAKPLAAKAKTN